MTASIHFTAERFGSVPKSYIHCTRDHGAVPPLQATMADALGCEPDFTLQTSHSPFLSAPGELADTLIEAAAVSGG